MVVSLNYLQRFSALHLIVRSRARGISKDGRECYDALVLRDGLSGLLSIRAL
jgi:hypothetical protein